MWKLKAVIGVFVLLVIAGLYSWGHHYYSKYHDERAKVEHIVGVTAEVALIPKLLVKDAPAAIRRIGSDRDTYYGNWQRSKAALADQTDRVIQLGDEKKSALETAARAQDQARRLIAQRDGWMQKARVASTRRARLDAEHEAAECEAALSDAREAGF